MPLKKVVFFFPAFASTEATAPLGILAVATPLLRAGYQVKLIDSTSSDCKVSPAAAKIAWYLRISACGTETRRI